MSKLATEEIRKIGFNDTVLVGPRTFHVQTEVLAVDGIKIKTTVSEGGVVRHSEIRGSSDDAGGVAAFHALVRAQHQRYLSDLQRMGFPWLAST